MKLTRSHKFFLVLAINLFSLLSCEKDDTLMYNNATMGNIVDGQFISDQGNIFNIVEQTCAGDVTSMTRAMVVCDVLNKTQGGAANEYDVRLTQLGRVLAKNIVYHEDTDEDMQVQDPVQIEYAWMSGGYMNLFIIFPVKAGSTTSHLINLVHEGCMTDAETKEEISGTYRFTLRHNSFGDKIEQPQTADYILTGGYVSFPLNSYITEKEADFAIEWVGHSTTTGGLAPETEHRTMSIKYTSDGFQHAPQSITAKASAHVR